jgi:DNA polymerase III subunit delta'
MFNKVIGQDRVKKILGNIYQSKKLAHAYIFYGKDGTGKDAMAIELARLINGEPESANIFRSPYFTFVTALPAGSDSEEDSDPLNGLDKKDFELYREEIEKKSEDPYYKISIPKANNIRIGSIRHIKKNIYLTGSESKKKVYLISEADKMSLQSSNALLKILEEPPKNSLLILNTSRLNSLLPTIVGRCQSIKFDDLSSEEIKDYIGRTFNNVSHEEASIYANLAEGSITRCNSILESNTLELRDKVIDILASLLGGKTISFGEDVNFITSLKDKEALRQFFTIMMIWFRDLSYQKSGIKNIINTDRHDRISRFNSNFNFHYYAIITSIEDAIKEIDMNINQELIFYNLGFKIKGYISKIQH